MMQKNITWLLLIWGVLLPLFLKAQDAPFQFNDETARKRIKRDIEFLAHDTLKGREAGTKQETYARNYIAGRMKEISIMPYFENSGYYQRFCLGNRRSFFVKGTELIINKEKLDFGYTYYPLNYSKPGKIKGELTHIPYTAISSSGTIQEGSSLSGKIVLVKLEPDNLKDNHGYIDDALLIPQIKLLSDAGAIGCIFFIKNKKYIFPYARNLIWNNKVDIPCAIASFSEDILNNSADTALLEIKIHYSQPEYSYNVAGFIDNGAPFTVIIGAHYDHIGMGMGASRYHGEPAVHNGADDNASGVAAMLEIASFLKNSDLKNNNYLFIAFSGEEKGLIGSMYFANNMDSSQSINYMLNFDMVGRLRKKLNIIGTGTSAIWEDQLNKISEKTLKVNNVKSWFGGSDHMSFYFKQIPVLFFTTGRHKSYHTPFDDVDKINFDGIVTIINYAKKLITALDKQGKAVYNPPKSETGNMFSAAIASALSVPCDSQKVEYIDTPSIKQRMLNDIAVLAADSMMGRETGTAGEKMARDYLLGQFEKIGLKPLVGDTSYLQPFAFSPDEEFEAIGGKAKKEYKGYNIAGYIDNNATGTIVLGAHYDHLGIKSYDEEQGENADTIYNGADDNASGVAAILELARYLKTSGKRNHNYIIIAFSGEEEGLLGSSAFVSEGVYDIEKIHCMLNFDMVGRLDTVNPLLNISGTGTSPLWDTLVANIAHQDFEIKTSPSGMSGSDQVSFCKKGIPVLFFFFGMHKDFHQPSDEVDKINMAGLTEVVTFAKQLIDRLDYTDSIPFTAVKPAASGMNRKGGVSLGVMPDMTYSGTGFRIFAVMEGRPADKAGLKEGDIVIKIGDSDIPDINVYMKALGQYRQGDKARVTVKRKEETITVEVEF